MSFTYSASIWQTTRTTSGGGPERAAAAKAIVGAGVAVMGHAGLMPQSVSVLGGFGPQGKSADAALLVIQDAIVRLPLLLT